MRQLCLGKTLENIADDRLKNTSECNCDIESLGKANS